MKRFFNIPLAIIILASALASGAQAQTSSAQRVVATIPFTFTVGNKTLPAGNYTVSVLNPSSDRKALQIRSMDGRSSAVILTNSITGNVADSAKLVFHRYGDHYVFAQARMADSLALAALRSRTEQKLWVASAKRKSVVVIAAE